ncbi:MAG: hypothetical protein ACLR17_00390 [Enterobacteriaceae bacterium]
MTWGAVAIFSDRLMDALDACNADKAAIRQWTVYARTPERSHKC